MRLILAALCALSGATAQPVTYNRIGNLVQFRGGPVSADLEWLGETAFRFRQDFGTGSGPHIPRSAAPVPYRTQEDGTIVRLTSRYLSVDVDRAGLAVSISTGREEPPIDLGIARKGAGKMVLERRLAAGELVFGLGESGSNGLSIRGRRITGPRGQILSSRGYGIAYRTPGVYAFDLGASTPERMRVVVQGSDFLEQYFYFGPGPKEILELHRQQTPAKEVASAALAVLKEADLPRQAVPIPHSGTPCELARKLTSAALSGVLYPALLAGSAPEPLLPFAPIVYTREAPPSSETAAARRAWTPYLIAYLREAYDRGLPMLRPLWLQFPRDTALADTADAFMIGDELLVAPPCDSSGTRKMRLPMGTWTDIRDNRRYSGKTEHTWNVSETSWPVLAKNGTIVPREAAGRRMELHYFPQLGAEFFLFEPGTEEHSQFHASPAGDFWRLEIETRISRRYEWVVHHVERPQHVGRGEVTLEAVDAHERLSPGTWFHDEERRNLHIAIDSLAHTDDIINIRFRQ